MIRADIPAYDAFQDELVARQRDRGAPRSSSSGPGPGRPPRRLLARHPDADAGRHRRERRDAGRGARRAAGASRVDAARRAARGPAPGGPFDLVASALCVHHLRRAGRSATCSRGCAAALAPGGRFVLADVVVPLRDPADGAADLADARLRQARAPLRRPARSGCEQAGFRRATVTLGATATWR